MIANGLFKSLLVISSYYWIKELAYMLRNEGQVKTQNIIYLLITAGLIVLLRLHERYIAEKMSQRYINTIRSSLLKRLMRASIRDIQNRTIGNLSSRLAGDLSAVKRWLSLGISRLITHTVLLAVTIFLIANINLYLGSVISFAIFTLVSMAMFIGNRLKKSIKKVRRNRIKIHSLLVERLSAIAMIRTMGKEGDEVNRINVQGKKLEGNIARQGIYLGLLRGVGEASAIILIALFYLVNGFSSIDLSIDEVTALISIILFLSSPIRELGRIQEYYQGAKLSINKIQELYNIPRIQRGRTHQVKVQRDNQVMGRIIVRNLHLEGVFSGINMTARQGEHIALTGKNGSGKSTLIQLLLGLIKRDSGRIRVNGINPHLARSHDRSRDIGYSSADAMLLNYSLRKNLCYRKPHARKSEINALLKFCQLQPLVKALDRGLNTRVHEQGQNFSSGERARISLFRALLGKPAVVILDEPESYLDEYGFEIIKQLLKNYQGTLIVATHNPELISLCQKEWNLDKIKLKRNKSMRLIKNHVE